MDAFVANLLLFRSVNGTGFQIHIEYCLHLSPLVLYFAGESDIRAGEFIDGV